MEIYKWGAEGLKRKPLFTMFSMTQYSMNSAMSFTRPEMGFSFFKPDKIIIVHISSQTTTETQCHLCTLELHPLPT